MKTLSSNQRYASVMLVLSISYGIMGWNIPAGFYSDPIGSSLWIVGISFCLLGLCFLLFFLPAEFSGTFPRFSEWVERLPFVLCIVAYSYLLPEFGFLLSTPPLIFCVSLMFQARLRSACISAVLMTLFTYLLFDLALDISLASGNLWK